MKAPITFANPELNAVLKLKGFRVSKNYVPKDEPTAFGRRNFYLILLSIGNSKVHYNNHTFHLNGAYLFFANPRIPYSTEILAENQMGYTCVFTESFLKPIERLESLQESPLFNYSESPAFKLNNSELERFTELFETMIDKASTSYLYKDDQMRNYIQLLVHEAMNMRPEEHYHHFNDASLRICSNFMEVLENQFPIEDLSTPLELKAAQDYANRLSIHVNYLNRAVKKIMGKPTTTVISERIIAEAINLLRFTDWSIADIAFALGFEYSNYFSNFFKKHTGQTPKYYRNN